MSNYGAIPTLVGLAQQVNKGLAGQSVVYTHIAFGDGEGGFNQSATALKNERVRIPINDIHAVPGDPLTFSIEGYLPPDVGGFYIREAAVFDEDENLCFIVNYPETYKPVLAEGVAEDFLINLLVTTSGEAEVSLYVDPSVAMASRPYVLRLMEDRDLTIMELRLKGAIAEVKADQSANHIETLQGEVDSIKASTVAITKTLIEISLRASRGCMN